MQPIRHIDLRFPRKWNQCSTEELEQIAEVTRDCVNRTDRYHPFNPIEVKMALFFLFAHLTITERAEADDPQNTYYMVKRKGDKTAFPLYLWQISYWLLGESGNPKDKRKKVKPGLLDWMDADSPGGLTIFPYPEMHLRAPLSWGLRSSLMGKSFAPPETQFATASYQQYITAQDYMQLYTVLQNKLLKMEASASVPDASAATVPDASAATVPDASALGTLTKQMNEARAKFLATIFNAKVDYIDSHTGTPKYGYHYSSTQTQDNYRYFLTFPDIKFQVILFWWSGIMRYLAVKFPHIFKTTKVNNQTIVSPLDAYTNTIASLQKYTSQTEESLNTQLHTVTLKDLDNMVHEAEEIEKMNKK